MLTEDLEELSRLLSAEGFKPVSQWDRASGFKRWTSMLNGHGHPPGCLMLDRGFDEVRSKEPAHVCWQAS